MTDELKLRKESSRGAHAKQIMADELVVEALNLIRTNLHSVWESSKHQEKEEREEAWKMLKAMNEFERFFVKTMEDGRVADKELSLMEKAKVKFKGYL